MLRIPDHIDAKMDLWRSGVTVLPQEYIDFHRETAEADLARRDWEVLRKEMVADGWCDGMKVLRVLIRVKPLTADQHVEVLKWHESGAWFRCLTRVGGWAREHEMLKEEDHGDV